MPSGIQRYFPRNSRETLTGYVEAASQTFKAGDFVTLDGAGRVATFIASGSAITTANAEKFAGVALRDAKNLSVVDPNVKCPFEKIDQDTELILAMYDAVATNAQQQDVVLGQFYGMKNQGGI